MQYALNLQKKIKELNIKKDEILFLVMEEEFLNEVKSDKVKVEHKKATSFMMSRLFKKNKEGVYSIAKNKTHLLLQSGYKSDSRRLLVRLNGWKIGAQNFPHDKELTIEFDDETPLDLYLGEVIFDSIGG